MSGQPTSRRNRASGAGPPHRWPIRTDHCPALLLQVGQRRDDVDPQIVKLGAAARAVPDVHGDRVNVASRPIASCLVGQHFDAIVVATRIASPSGGETVANLDSLDQGRAKIAEEGGIPLITAETSLIARFNSLQGRKKFPVRMHRELAGKKLISCPFSLLPRHRRGPNDLC